MNWGMKSNSAFVLLAPIVTATTIAINIMVFLAFLQNHDFIFPLLDNWSNFPWGLLTAVFTPDSQVFLCYTGVFSAGLCFQNFTNWLLVTGATLVFCLALFFLANVNRGLLELGFRSAFYAGMLIFISIISNLVTLFQEPKGSVGPSTAIFAGFGMIVGFSLANMTATTRSIIRTRLGYIEIVVATAIAIALIAYAILEPAEFFNIDPAQKINSMAHEFCFVVGIFASILFGKRGTGPCTRPCDSARAP